MNLKSFYKTARLLLSNRPFSIEKPIVLQFPVIDICNSQCQMCRIWENKKSEVLSPEQLRLGLRNSLYTEVESVGLNGGEPTLRKDLGQLTEVLFDELPKLKSISLITNAYKYEEVIARIKDVGEVVRRHGGVLDVMISLDGYGEVHDRVRGKPGNFERAQRVIEFTQSSELVNNTRIGCTIIKENVFGLSDLFEFCQSKGLYIKYRLGIPHQRLYTNELVDPYELNDAEKYHIVEFLEGLITHYEQSEHQKFFYRSLIDQILHGSPRKAGCDWQHRGATITSKGELLYCAVQSKILGNIKDQDSEKLYFGNADHLSEIVKNHCDNCNHDYVGVPPKAQLIKQLAVQVANKLNAKNKLKGAYRRIASSDYRRRRMFESKIKHLRELGRASKLWPNGGKGKRILICGWYGTETLGDKGILGGVLSALRDHLSELDIVLVSLNPYITAMTQSQMSELLGVRIVGPEVGVQLAGMADLTVFGGGPIMAIDETAEMLAIFEATKNAGGKTLLAGCGVGPLGATWHNETIRKIIQLADSRIFRDENSQKISAKLGVDTSQDIIAEDPAFTWLASQRNAIKQENVKEGGKVLLLGLRDFPFSTYAGGLGEEKGRQIKRRSEKAILQALCSLVEQYPNLIIRPLPMCTNHFGDDDRWYYRDLFRFQEQLAENLDLSLLGAELNPLEYCEAFVNADVALTMRFHSVVFSLGLDLPTVAIDYTVGKGKVRALAERFKVPYCSINELNSKFLSTQIARLLEEPQAQAMGFSPSFSNAMNSKLAFLGFSVSPDEASK